MRWDWLIIALVLYALTGWFVAAAECRARPARSAWIELFLVAAWPLVLVSWDLET